MQKTLLGPHKRRMCREQIISRERQLIHARRRPALQSRVMLDEQRSGAISHANFELNLQETKAEHVVQNLSRQLRQLFTEPAKRSQECDKFRKRKNPHSQATGEVSGALDGGWRLKEETERTSWEVVVAQDVEAVLRPDT